ncbi:MAG: DUF4342 domain-containing protein [Candidatus Bipolaricaulia bacterium]
MAEKKTTVEVEDVEGSKLIDRVGELLHEARVRRISIKNKEGRTLLDIPLWGGAVAAVIAPIMAAVGAAAALLVGGQIEVEREEEEEGEE